jgi:hypothetical protein
MARTLDRHGRDDSHGRDDIARREIEAATTARQPRAQEKGPKRLHAGPWLLH